MINEKFTFHNLGIDIRILELLDKLEFVIPTPIQRKAIPAAVAGKDIIGVAQTGTGKTLAFGIPMLQQLALHGGKGLVLVPTRELAIQVNETLVKLAPAFGFYSAVLIGGVSVHSQIKALKKEPTIVIATPGRLNDLLNRNLVRLSEFKLLVLDEADRMLDMGFLPQIEIIIKRIPKERHTMLFSATIPQGIIEIAANYMKSPVHIEVAPSGTVAETVTQELFVVKGEHKGKLLGELLKKYSGSILIFTRTKRGASKVTKLLRSLEYKAAEIHSDRSQSQRKEALDRFKAGKYRILTATDIASRGIDVTGIELVINYDIPEDPENYIHRIGRTGRAGKSGHAISFATPEQGADIRSIEKIMRSSIPLAVHPIIPSEKLFGSHSSGRPEHRVAGNYKAAPKSLTHAPGSSAAGLTSISAAAGETAVKRISKSRYNTKSWKDYQSKPFVQGTSRRSGAFKGEEKPSFPHKEFDRNKTTPKAENRFERSEGRGRPSRGERFSPRRPGAGFPRAYSDKNHIRPKSGNRYESNEGRKKPGHEERFSPRRPGAGFPRAYSDKNHIRPKSGNRYESNEGRKKPSHEGSFPRRAQKPFAEKTSLHNGAYRSNERKPFYGKRSGKPYPGNMVKREDDPIPGK
ncbi:MAG: DEAD/DEAH box helicase [Candidatus Firestonebacteria bacterium]|nr:DEAD/DEAH box helicase [Candidatus Firestonebacteria bacterium]